MAKTKKHLNRRLAVLSLVLVLGVVITGTHLKEVLSHLFNLPSPVVSLDTTKKISDDTGSKKVSNDLHSHIEKQTLKNIVKISGDDVARTDRRHVKHKLKGRKAKLPRFTLPNVLHYFSV